MRLVIGYSYMITTNIDVEDGSVNGAIAVLKYVESGQLNDKTPTCLWFHFENENMGAKQRIKPKPHLLSKRGELDLSGTPVTRRNISLGGNVKCKRTQFLVVLECALTRAVHSTE